MTTEGLSQRAFKEEMIESESDYHIRGMIKNIDAYRKKDRSLAEHLLIMDLQALRVIIRRERVQLAGSISESGCSA